MFPNSILIFTPSRWRGAFGSSYVVVNRVSNKQNITECQSKEEGIVFHSFLTAQTPSVVLMLSSHYLALHFVPTATSPWQHKWDAANFKWESDKLECFKWRFVLQIRKHTVSTLPCCTWHTLCGSRCLCTSPWRMCASCHLLCVNNNSTVLWEGVTNNLSLRKLYSVIGRDLQLWNLIS